MVDEKKEMSIQGKQKPVLSLQHARLISKPGGRLKQLNIWMSIQGLFSVLDADLQQLMMRILSYFTGRKEAQQRKRQPWTDYKLKKAREASIHFT